MLKKNFAYVVMLICFAVLLWRSFYGFCWTDESFYVSTADRFYRGVVPLVGEWYRTQLSSVVMLPFYKIFILFTGSTDGIILYFRILYLVISTLVAFLYYRVLRKDYPDTVSLSAALIIMCYAHFNNATFSYYMLSFIFLAAALILIYDYKNNDSKTRLIVSGMLIALSVLSMPAFAVGYAIVMVIVFAAVIAEKIPLIPDSVKSVIRDMNFPVISFWTIVGILIPATIFIVYMLGKVSLPELMNALSYSLVDNEHAEPLGYFIRKPNRCLKEVFGDFTNVSYALIAITFLFQKFLKKHEIRHFITIADILVFCVMAYLGRGRVGYIQAAFFLFMIPLFFITQKKNHRLFWLMTIPAGLVALIYSFTSSDFLYVMAIGFAIASGAGLCIYYDLVKDISEDDLEDNMIKNIIRVTGTACAIVLVLVTFALRLKNVYRDAPIPQLTAKITTGVAKGLYTKEEHLRQYNDVNEVIGKYLKDTEKFEIISGNPAGNVLFSKILPWGYVESTLSCGYPTTWRATAYDDKQLNEYYNINKTSAPDVIMVLDTAYGSYDAAGDVEDDHNPNLDEMPDYWKDYIKNNGFTETKVGCGRLYFKHKGDQK